MSNLNLNTQQKNLIKYYGSEAYKKLNQNIIASFEWDEFLTNKEEESEVDIQDKMYQIVQMISEEVIKNIKKNEQKS